MQPWQLLQGDCLQVLATLPAESVQTCITSPPYWGLRDYGAEGQLGLEATPELYVASMVAVFREVRRVLRDDGTLWLNLGDSYAGAASGSNPSETSKLGSGPGGASKHRDSVKFAQRPAAASLKPKDLVGIPWRVAFALQADGWYLRQDIIWHKPNPMPESVTDRCTKAHEYIFLMTKSPRYFYDAEAIKELSAQPIGEKRWTGTQSKAVQTGNHSGTLGTNQGDPTRNRRSVWTVTTKPFKGAHFATFPPDLIEPCVLAGSADKCCSKCGKPWERVVKKDNPPNDGTTQSAYAPGMTANRLAMKRQAARERGEEFVNRVRTLGFSPACNCGETARTSSTVLDPFNGAGTTGVVAIQHGRRYIGIELNPDYLEMARKRIQETRDGITLPLGI